MTNYEPDAAYEAGIDALMSQMNELIERIDSAEELIRDSIRWMSILSELLVAEDISGVRCNGERYDILGRTRELEQRARELGIGVQQIGDMVVSLDRIDRANDARRSEFPPVPDGWVAIEMPMACVSFDSEANWIGPVIRYKHRVTVESDFGVKSMFGSDFDMSKPCDVLVLVRNRG